MKLPKQMRQYVLEDVGRIEQSTVDLPGLPDAGWALVKVGAVGMCGTDYHAFHGKQNFFTFPRVLGHEVGCTIVALGKGSEASNLQVGDRCAVVPYWGCGQCVACRRGKTNCCTDIRVIGVHIDGAMTEYLQVPLDKLVPSKVLPLEQLALVETLCIAAHAVHRASPCQGENALVVGAGPIGMGVAQFAKAAGCKVAVMDINDQRLGFIKEAVGIEHTVNSTKCDQLGVEETLRKVFDSELPTLVIDATGNINSMESCFQYAAHGGKIVFVGHTKQRLSFDNPTFHARELSVLASRNALPEDFARVINLIENGKIDVSAWVTHRCAMDDYVSNFMEWMKPEAGVIKAIVEIEKDVPEPPTAGYSAKRDQRAKAARALCKLCGLGGCECCQDLSVDGSD